MTYAFQEGQVAVPARRCTRCGGPLVQSDGDLAGVWTGWFERSTLSDSVWVFSGRPEPEVGEGTKRTTWVCQACDRRFALHER